VSIIHWRHQLRREVLQRSSPSALRTPQRHTDQALIRLDKRGLRRDDKPLYISAPSGWDSLEEDELEDGVDDGRPLAGSA
jgi:hypothetical protein